MSSTNPSRFEHDSDPFRVNPNADTLTSSSRSETPHDRAEERLIQPDEGMWRRYSPNAEMPISGLASAVLHVLVLGVLLVGAAAWFGEGAESKRGSGVVEFEPAGDGLPPGGGGDIAGVDKGLQQSAPRQDVNPQRNDSLTPKAPEMDAAVRPMAGPMLPPDPDGATLVEKLRKTKPAYAGIYLRDLLNGMTGKGDGGKGKGGGKGDGDGPGVGNDTGGIGGKPAVPDPRRVKRALRWTLNFNTASGEDYVRQLNALEAYLGVPDAKGNLLIIRNLSERPAKPRAEDLRAINRIFWVDDRPESARAVADVLHLEMIPGQLVAFFPEEIERQILRTELAYGKRFGRMTENDIKETEFNVIFRAGKPVFVVKRQEGIP